MNKKQLLWLIVAVLLFAGTGYAGIVSAREARQQSQETLQQMSSLFTSAAQDTALPAAPFVGKVSVEGAIQELSGTAALYGDGFDLAATEDYIDRLIRSENNVALLLYINSPGGTMSASDDLYYKLMDYRATGRPIYCYFGDMACSGAYYIAMAADEIYANRNSTCVNIGVYVSTYNYAGLFEKLGIEQINIKSSENKGIGLTGTPWTQEQLDIYQSMVDLYYQQFLTVVAESRGMTADEVKTRDDGREMLAAQALEAGFIDGVCRYEEYEEQVLAACGAGVTLYEPAPALSWVKQFTDYFGALRQKSDAQVLQEFVDAHSGVVVMAYAGA